MFLINMLLTDWIGKNIGRTVSVEFFRKQTHGKEETTMDEGGELLGVFPVPTKSGVYLIKVKGMTDTVFYPTRLRYCEEIKDGLVFYDGALQRETVLRILPTLPKSIKEQQILSEFEKLKAELGSEIYQKVRNLSAGSRSSIAHQAAEELWQTKDERVIRFVILGLSQEFSRGYANYWTMAGAVLSKFSKKLPRVVQENVLEALLSGYKDFDCIAYMLVSPDIMKMGHLPLVKSFDKNAVEPLIEAFKKANKYTKSNLAEALGVLGDARAVPALIGALLSDDEVPITRMNSAKGLGEIGDKRALEPLTQLLEHDYEGLRNAVKSALEKISPK